MVSLVYAQLDVAHLLGRSIDDMKIAGMDMVSTMAYFNSLVDRML
jgi:hypothetical protein